MTVFEQLQHLNDLAYAKVGKYPYIGANVGVFAREITASIYIESYDNRLSATGPDCLDQLLALVEAYEPVTPALILKQKLADAYAYAEQHGLEA